MPNHASTSLCHPIETRALSVKEYSRIQGFPDEWGFSGTTSKKYEQIGNAVPVRLGAVAGEVLAKTLDTLHKNNYRQNKVKVNGFRIVYIQSHIRTRKWFDGSDAVIFDHKSRKSSYSSPKTIRKSKAIG